MIIDAADIFQHWTSHTSVVSRAKRILRRSPGARTRIVSESTAALRRMLASTLINTELREKQRFPL